MIFRLGGSLYGERGELTKGKEVTKVFVEPFVP